MKGLFEKTFKKQSMKMKDSYSNMSEAVTYINFKQSHLFEGKLFFPLTDHLWLPFSCFL